jgi:hypothetical protein
MRHGNLLNYSDMTLTLINEDELPERIAESLKKIEEINYTDLERTHILQREGAIAVDQLCSDFIQNQRISDPQIVAHVLVRLQDLQVRDYAMGSITATTIEALWKFWRELASAAPYRLKAPALTIFAAICYELEDCAGAQDALTEALFDDPDYPLAKLLRRVFSAGWPPESLAIMRSELHPKITASIFG